MIIKKLFLTTYSEKVWLENMARKGYVLTRHRGISYQFEKSDNNVFYRYIFLKNGRKSFVELDYKNRDPKCRFVYGNSYFALFLKEGDRPALLSNQELKLNYLRYRQGRYTAAICYVAACCAFIVSAKTFLPMLLIAGIFAVLAALYMLDVKHIDKMIKEEI